MGIHAYKWHAKDYAKHSSAQKKWADEMLAKLSLFGAENVLDLGCGDGKISAQIASMLKQGNVLGIDSSASMIELAQQQYSSCENLSFKQQDAIDFCYSERFDLIFSNAVLHWVEDHLSVLKNCANSLRQGGKILLQMGGKGNANELLQVIEEVINQPSWQPYFKDFSFPYYFYGKEEYKNWLDESALKIERIELIEKDMQHESCDALLGWIRTAWMPYTNRVAEKQRNEFIDDIMKTYLGYYPADDTGRTHVNMVRLEVAAMKA